MISYSMLRSASIGIVGGGNIGANIAYLLSEQHIADRLLLYDPNTGQAVGKALDIIESAPLRRPRNGPQGVTNLQELNGSDIIVWALEPPPPALKDSGGAYNIDDELAQVTSILSDFSGVLVVAASPSDTLVQQFCSTSALASRSVIGLGTLPATRRLRSSVSVSLSIDESNIDTMVIGNARTPTVVRSLLRVSGIPIDIVAESSLVDGLCQQCEAEGEPQLFQDPFFIAGVATELIETIVYDLRRPLPVATMSKMSTQKKSQQVFSLPTIVGASGALRTLESSELTPHMSET